MNEPPIPETIITIINFLSFGVGIAVVGMIVFAGIQYITSGGVPQKIDAARSRITNAVIALVLYIFMYAIIQWLIPGGLFGSSSEADCPPNVSNCGFQ